MGERNVCYVCVCVWVQIISYVVREIFLGGAKGERERDFPPDLGNVGQRNITNKESIGRIAHFSNFFPGKLMGPSMRIVDVIFGLPDRGAGDFLREIGIGSQLIVQGRVLAGGFDGADWGVGWQAGLGGDMGSAIVGFGGALRERACQTRGHGAGIRIQNRVVKKVVEGERRRKKKLEMKMKMRKNLIMEFALG